MNPTAKIIASVTAGIVTGAFLGILFSERNEPKNVKSYSNKIAGDFTNSEKKTTVNKLEKDLEEAVKEAFAENPEEYA